MSCLLQRLVQLGSNCWMMPSTLFSIACLPIRFFELSKDLDCPERLVVYIFLRILLASLFGRLNLSVLMMVDPTAYCANFSGVALPKVSSMSLGKTMLHFYSLYKDNYQNKLDIMAASPKLFHQHGSILISNYWLKKWKNCHNYIHSFFVKTVYSIRLW